MPARTDRLHIRLTDDEREAVAAAAEREGESVSTVVRRAIREWLLRYEGKRRGIIRSAPDARRRG